MSGSSRWLWITAELPRERSTGRLEYSGQIAMALADAGVQLTVVGLGDEPSSQDGITWSAVNAPLRGGWRSLLSMLPNLAYACAGPEMRSTVTDLLTESWEVVVWDHLQTAWAVRHCPGRQPVITVFVTHNHEASVRRLVATEAPWHNGRRIVLGIDAWKAARLEKAAARAADIVTSITAEDRDLFEVDAPGSDHLLLSPGWSPTSLPALSAMKQRPRRVGILGSFDWHVKQENLRRFLSAADRIFSKAGVELVVAGRVPDDFRQDVGGGLTATRFVGWVDSKEDFLNDCRVGVVAEPLGGGFKMKSLDYVFHGVAVASLKGSLAGIPLIGGTSMIEADQPESLAAKIVALVDDDFALEQMAHAALAACESHFGWESRAADLVERVAALRTTGSFRCENRE